MIYIIFWAKIYGEEKFNLVEFCKDSYFSHTIEIFDGTTFASYQFQDLVEETDFLLRYGEHSLTITDENHYILKNAISMKEFKE